jgi:hypothetical protein
VNSNQKNFRNYVLRYMNYLSTLDSRPMTRTLYSEWMRKYLESLNQFPIDSCVSVILGSLEKYIKMIKSNKSTNVEAYEKTKNADLITTDFEWAVDTVVKHKEYQRQVNFLFSGIQFDLVDELSKIALRMPYHDAISFLGELAGAWVLTYPIAAIRFYERDLAPLDWANDETDYIHILRRRIHVEIDEWRR